MEPTSPAYWKVKSSWTTREGPYFTLKVSSSVIHSSTNCVFSKTFMSWCFSDYSESLCHSGRSLPKREWAVSTRIFCTLDQREICSSSAEVANMKAIESLLSCGPAGSSLGCEEEGSGMPRDCVGPSLSPTLSFSFIVSKAAAVHSGQNAYIRGSTVPLEVGVTVGGGGKEGKGSKRKEAIVLH